MSGAAVDRETERKANDLYWGSRSSVNQIAEALDLSKGTLYGLIRPLPSGLTCPDCSQEAVYPNRTAKERSLVACPSCGWEGDEMDTETGGGDGTVAPPDLSDVVDDVAPPPVAEGHRRRIMVGGALLGAAAGLALVIWARRR
jgi:hypothetical protein